MSGPFGSTAWMYNPSTEFYGFEISNSLRFEDGDSALLSRTPSSASNRDTWTWSAWVKRGNIGAAKGLFAAPEGTSGNTAYLDIIFTADDQLAVSSYATLYRKTTRLFRDPSAWYHLVVAVDTTDGTADDRIKIYVNGVQETSFVTNNAKTQNEDTGINSAVVHEIGDGGNHFDGYMAEVNFVDGSQLTPSSFGETKNDIWIPKNTSGLTFGTNGFRLQFKQTGTGTASSSTIGADTSGNDNHWTSTNLVASDVVPDSPTNNWCVMNALEARASYGMPTLSEGSLKYSNAGISSSWGFRTTSFELTSGKWWGECRVSGNTSAMVGIFNTGGTQGLSQFNTQNPMNNTGSFQLYMDVNTTKFRTASSDASVAFTDFNEGDVVGLALDVDNETCKWYVNGSIQGNIGTKDVSISGNEKRYVMTAGMADSGASTFVWNFGQDSTFAGEETAAANQDENALGNFHHAVPSGYLSICSANFPAPVATIDPNEGGSPQDYFNTVLYSGNSSTQAITGVGFQPDFTWSKTRNVADHHILVDSVRGDKALRANSTDDEYDTGVSWQFNSDGFTMTGTSGELNYSGRTYATWNWKAGTAFSNDASATSVGSIDSTGSVNTDIGFSIISWTGTGSNGTIAHGLGVAPEMYIVKRRDADGHSWAVYTATLGATKQLRLSGTNAEITTANIWNNTEPTSSVFSVGTNTDSNASSGTHIAYCFASVDGFSKVGSSYTGNGSTDGPFVYTGFRPAFTILKRIDAADRSWILQDSARNPTNPVITTFSAEASDQEYTSDASGGYNVDYVSNGFKIRNTNVNWNASGGTYIYMAFAEQPFKYANAR